jgi:hypothetical protein
LRIKKPTKIEGGGLDDVIGGPGGGNVQALQLNQLQSEYQRYREQLADATRRREDYLARAQRENDPRDRQRRLERVREQEQRITRYRGKLAELEGDIRAFKQRAGLGRPPEPAPKERRPRTPATQGKSLVRVDVLVIEIDPPG